MVSNSEAQAQDRARSYRNLQHARDAASASAGYDSHETRTRIHALFRERFGSDAREWQVDVTEALLLGLDCLVIVGTGGGKTMPFMMPLMLDPMSKSIILSPLKILQLDQTSRFRKMGITAAAVNGDTWSENLHEKLKDGAFQGILASPEMCLKHAEFRGLLTNSSFQGIKTLAVDEAHCISQWGGDFRPTYSELAKLRAFFPPHIPVLATTATANSQCLREIRSCLGIDPTTSFYLNLGNDRPNISYHVHQISSTKDLDAIRPHLSHTVPSPSARSHLPKTIVFVNAVLLSQIAAREIQQWFPNHLRKCVDYLHAHRSPQAKQRVMDW
ncbi:P-loop containing nucleoside triphosphate hydrolase protein [Pholiota conissans]|uniref:DNA 3'-5' helicase n=1 Tax=Pholiota conissans TaxID=109636 RepID=A0A9P5YSN1_9AGAR|nr:P-loop containing nucleoside triphosphate hydrolase protein [Pholiota conissans]